MSSHYFTKYDFNALCDCQSLFPWQCFDPGHMTPAFALMKKRSDEVKPLVYRTPMNFLPRERPRSSSYAFGVDWRSLADLQGEQEREAKKSEHT